MSPESAIALVELEREIILRNEEVRRQMGTRRDLHLAEGLKERAEALRVVIELARSAGTAAGGER